MSKALKPLDPNAFTKSGSDYILKNESAIVSELPWRSMETDILNTKVVYSFSPKRPPAHALANGHLAMPIIESGTHESKTARVQNSKMQHKSDLDFGFGSTISSPELANAKPLESKIGWGWGGS